MDHAPVKLKKIIDHFDAMPGIGPKHAARLALYLMGRKDRAQLLSADIRECIDSIALCRECQNITEEPLCSICSDNKRETACICVVSHIQDIEPIERTGKFNGRYHVLHGMISPIEGIGPEQIKSKELFSRVSKNGIREVILALDATSEGEMTAMFFAKQLRDRGITVTQLARGIPVGSSIEYTDEVTLSSAIENRR